MPSGLILAGRYGWPVRCSYVYYFCSTAVCRGLPQRWHFVLLCPVSLKLSSLVPSTRLNGDDLGLMSSAALSNLCLLSLQNLTATSSLHFTSSRITNSLALLHKIPRVSCLPFLFLLHPVPPHDTTRSSLALELLRNVRALGSCHVHGPWYWQFWGYSGDTVRSCLYRDMVHI